jgi:hypothetical protein
MGRAMNDLRSQEMGDIGYDVCRRERRESPPGILGQVILVISGQSRMMYQCLKPKPEGAIFSKRSKPQDAVSSPHDTGASIANWLESNIQGRSRLPVTAVALRDHELRHKTYLASRLPYHHAQFSIMRS